MSVPQSAFMTDGEVAKLIGISVYSFRDAVKNGPPASAPLAIDWRLVERVHVGRFRRWRRAAVLRVLGITEAEIPSPTEAPRPFAGNRKAERGRSPCEAEGESTRRAIPLGRQTPAAPDGGLCPHPAPAPGAAPD